MNIHLRSTKTGKVMTQEEWLHSLNEWEDEGGAPGHADEFIEVYKNDEEDEETVPLSGGKVRHMKS